MSCIQTIWNRVKPWQVQEDFFLCGLFSLWNSASIVTGSSLLLKLVFFFVSWPLLLFMFGEGGDTHWYFLVICNVILLGFDVYALVSLYIAGINF